MRTNQWIYIDEYDKLPDATSIHCDTRDFHVLCHTDIVTNETFRNIRAAARKQGGPIDKYEFNRSEILGVLKAIEQATGGRGEWRCIPGFSKSGWLKYIRFIKTNEVIDLGTSQEPVYIAFTGSDRDMVLLSREDLNPDGWEIDKDHLCFIPLESTVGQMIQKAHYSQNQPAQIIRCETAEDLAKVL